MAKFKNKYTHGSSFSFQGNRIKVSGWEFETEDKEMIEFLSQNPNWDLLSGKAAQNSPVETKVDFSKLSASKLKELLIEKGIEIPEDADKKELLALLNK